MSLTNDLQQINQQISLEDAVEMVARYRTGMQGMLKPEYSGMDILPVCETFSKSIFSDLASQSGCVAIRSYFGIDENQLIRLIFVAVDDNNDDVLNSMFEHGIRCPPICPPTGPLNPAP